MSFYGSSLNPFVCQMLCVVHVSSLDLHDHPENEGYWFFLQLSRPGLREVGQGYWMQGFLTLRSLALSSFQCRLHALRGGHIFSVSGGSSWKLHRRDGSSVEQSVTLNYMTNYCWERLRAEASSGERLEEAAAVVSALEAQMGYKVVAKGHNDSRSDRVAFTSFRCISTSYSGTLCILTMWSVSLVKSLDLKMALWYKARCPHLQIPANTPAASLVRSSALWEVASASLGMARAAQSGNRNKPCLLRLAPSIYLHPSPWVTTGPRN